MTDARGYMKPAAFLNFTQEIACKHADVLGFGFDTLREENVAWILSRMHIKFNGYPRWKDYITVNTWHKWQERLFYLRDFSVKDSQGNDMILATTSWLLMNLETRRISRHLSAEIYNNDNSNSAIEQPCDKVVIPAGLESELVCEHRVSYSDLDVNQHTNNVMYIVWAMDAVDSEISTKISLKELKINYNHETKLGDVINIYRTCVKEGDSIKCFIEGKFADGTSSFVTEFIF